MWRFSESKKVTRRITALTNKEIGDYFNISDSAVGKADKKAVGLLREGKRLKKKVDNI